MVIRFTTPKCGKQYRTIAGTPGGVPKLLWAGCTLGLWTLLTTADVIVLGHKMREPLHLYHWIALFVVLAIHIVGVIALERRWPSQIKRGEPRDGTEHPIEPKLNLP
jgi:hypothetical protein